jgi:hypothetical protein
MEDSVFNLIDLVNHAATCIEEYTDADGNSLVVVKDGNLLRYVVLKHGEVVFAESCNSMPVAIFRGRCETHKLGVDLDWRNLLGRVRPSSRGVAEEGEKGERQRSWELRAEHGRLASLDWRNLIALTFS